MQRFNELSEKARKEIRMYGVTVDEMRKAVEESLTFRFSGPAMYAASLMSDCQEMLAHDNGSQFDIMIVEDVRQTLNRAKWILFNYVNERDVA